MNVNEPSKWIQMVVQPEPRCGARWLSSAQHTRPPRKPPSTIPTFQQSHWQVLPRETSHIFTHNTSHQFTESKCNMVQYGAIQMMQNSWFGSRIWHGLMADVWFSAVGMANRLTPRAPPPEHPERQVVNPFNLKNRIGYNPGEAASREGLLSMKRTR